MINCGVVINSQLLVYDNALQILCFKKKNELIPLTNRLLTFNSWIASTLLSIHIGRLFEAPVV